MIGIVDFLWQLVKMKCQREHWIRHKKNSIAMDLKRWQFSRSLPIGLLVTKSASSPVFDMDIALKIYICIVTEQILQYITWNEARNVSRVLAFPNWNFLISRQEVLFIFNNIESCSVLELRQNKNDSIGQKIGLFWNYRAFHCHIRWGEKRGNCG